MMLRPVPRNRRRPNDLPPITLSRRTPQPLVAVGVALLALVYALTGLPARTIALVVALLGAAYVVWWWYSANWHINGRIGATLGNVRGWSIHAKHFPLYKFVDIYRAAQHYATQHSGTIELRAAHHYILRGILSGVEIRERAIQVPVMVARKVGYEQEDMFPSDTFWLLRSADANGDAIVRVTFPLNRMSLVNFEVAAPTQEQATQVMDAILALAAEHSIYRNRTIRVTFGPEVRNAFGDDESNEPMDLAFVREEAITDENIVLDDATRQVIDHTILDFHRRRVALMALGLPGKRGVLFYGPPGTGKTYTCKYIGQQLPTATKLVVTGHALLHMKSVCAIAKMLQPALVLLEDVDLVFNQREINAYSTVLGEFIDQLDGFGETDQIIFIMTTNAIDRIEAAIKDRPGRVSQCIFFGAPTAPLRHRYLATLMRPYHAPKLNLDRVVAQTDGVSQAFLKELVFRSVQVATAEAANGLLLTNAHFDVALHEMTTGSGRAAKRIIGFRVEADTDGAFS